MGCLILSHLSLSDGRKWQGWTFMGLAFLGLGLWGIYAISS
jgi:hypothetical protein